MNICHLVASCQGLGAKKIYDRFCAGSSDHISIRQLQLILLKVSLILGVEIIFNVRFKTLLPPFVDEQNGELTKGIFNIQSAYMYFELNFFLLWKSIISMILL